jgi:tRNA-dihydrouridine synthase B
MSFWKTLEKPIIGLAPMDGVTDAACRYITATVGKPDVVFTEFTAVEGLRAGAVRLLHDFAYSPLERPVVAQVFGVDPEAFRIAAILISALGFDGIDINMGCPAPNVTSRGAGAALIRTPEHASAIITATKLGNRQWVEGITLDEIGVPRGLIEKIVERMESQGGIGPRIPLPVSVKTRTGYAEPSIESWIPHLARHDLAAITLHGRTLKQLYTGLANWDLIEQAGVIVRAESPGTIFLGNGDVQNREDALSLCSERSIDGVLVGRAAIGNPWFFTGHIPTPEERISCALDHARYLDATFGQQGFTRIRKHLLEYTKSFPGAKLIRTQLSTITNLTDVERILSDPAILAPTH